jgi:protein-S-isoprenylcysteine O-methyltransferase Ste14
MIAMLPSLPVLRIVKTPPPVWTLAFLAVAYGVRSMGGWGAVVIFRSTATAVLSGGAGLGVAAWAVMIFAYSGTEIEPASPANTLLVTRSPFNFTRNPMYLSLVLMSLGCAFYFGAWPFFAVPVLVFLLCNSIFIPFEEEKMARQFGDQYTEYCAKVRQWL